MQELLNNWIPNVMSRLPDFYKAIGDTLLMVVWSGAISFVLGLALGVLLTVTKPGGILQNRVIYQILDKLVSLFRSIPFIILLTWVLPVSRAIMGTAIYVRGAIVPLVFGAVPFFARQVQSALAELDGGLIEAALSMGSSPLEIIFRVYLRESVASIARGTTITAISLLNLTAMAGVVGAIYDDIWKPAQEALKAEGINLEIVQFSDYVTPNNALANGEIDLNAFQHRIYLQGEIANYGYEIQNIGNTFIAPMSLFSSKISSVSELKDGDIIAIPDDLTNGGRALKVLESAGIITLNPDAGFNPTLDDIQTYNIGVTIKELKANVIVSALPDVTAAIVNNNYALDFGLSASDAIFADDRLDIEDYWNLIAARTADLSDPDKVEIFRKVVEAYQSDATLEVFNTECRGFYTPAGWDQDLLPQT